MKQIDTVVEDIYKILDEGTEVTDEQADEFGRRMAAMVKDRLKPREDKRTLRLSSIGKPLYQTWLEMKGVEKEKLEPWVKNKFIFGDMTEEWLIFLTKLAGHSVTEEQKTVEIEGVKGHTDCRIDGTLTDIKSASSFAFKKFKEGTYLSSGAFADMYRYQIAAYYAADKRPEDDGAAFLAMDKQMGHIALMKVCEFDLPDPRAKIREIKEALEKDEMPPLSYEPIEDGKSGNMILPTEGTYCPYKWHVWPNLRCFLYSNGPRYFTHIEKEPRDGIPEINKHGEIINAAKEETF